MHPYSTTSERAVEIAFCLCGRRHRLGVVVVADYRKNSPTFLAGGSGHLYAVLHLAVDISELPVYLWKWQLFQATGIVKVPDISGDWSGYVTSSFDSLAQQHPVRVRIRQNWTHLLIQLSTEQSESESIVASVTVEDETVLSYQYTNMPRPGAKDTMHAHIGTAVLKLHDNRSELSGEYYSGRDRANQGMIVLTKRPSQ